MQFGLFGSIWIAILKFDSVQFGLQILWFGLGLKVSKLSSFSVWSSMIVTLADNNKHLHTSV